MSSKRSELSRSAMATNRPDQIVRLFVLIAESVPAEVEGDGPEAYGLSAATQRRQSPQDRRAGRTRIRFRAVMQRARLALGT
jgi:hypothetical protein